jgi:diguanylate cyclase (GGDEF)-like protein/PAS domain S-box-containing protein
MENSPALFPALHFLTPNVLEYKIGLKNGFLPADHMAHHKWTCQLVVFMKRKTRKNTPVQSSENNNGLNESAVPPFNNTPRFNPNNEPSELSETLESPEMGISASSTSVAEIREALRTTQVALTNCEEEKENTFEQFEEAVARANEMTMASEVAQLEFDQIFDAVGDPIWIVSNEFDVLRINRAFLKTLQREKNQALGQKCHDLLPFAFCHTEDCSVVKIGQSKVRVEVEIELKLENDKETPYLLTSTPVLGLSGEVVGIVEHYKDVSELKKKEEALKVANETLQRLATVDELTQLFNRRLFDERLEYEWQRLTREQAPLSLVLCDIDYFKLYNDYYGHQLGDDCLRVVAKQIKGAARRTSDVAARYGGEEFVLILPNTPSMGGATVAERIRENVQALCIEHAHSKYGDRVTLSFGVATMVPSLSAKNEQLVKAADEALYAAKEQGRNRVVIHQRFNL